tara:strand:- start:354 stop:1463 length:1110 start_codon:yes stop_codon:yes gene_type:complete
MVFLLAVIFFLFCLILLFFIIRKSNNKSNSDLSHDLEKLKDGQLKLAGIIENLVNNQNLGNANILSNMEGRLSEVQKQIFDSLSGSASNTAKSLGALQERLIAIDKAQANLEKLSGNVLGLQDILSNKQTRGVFGEIQLKDIVSKALPPNSYAFQVLLKNGRRVDCMIYLPYPPGPIAIDSKFPLDAYENLGKFENEIEKNKAIQIFKKSIRFHINSISEKYIVEGETADGAIMFLPSEAIYAELHANFSDIIHEGFSKRVWIVSPTTCMATLNTIRGILKDATLKENSSKIRENLNLLFKDVSRLGNRIDNLDKHFNLASKDLEEVKVSAQKVTNRADKFEALDFGEIGHSPIGHVGSKISKLNMIKK